jgi:hypothetical protein
MLRELQASLFEGLYDPTRTDALGLIEPGARSAAEQLTIYRNSMFGGLAKALLDVYPVCNKLVGTEFFGHMSSLYIEQHRSTSPDIGDYGEGLADFIADFAPAASLPYLADVARLEWAWHRAINAPDETALDTADAAVLAGQDVTQLVLQPACSLGLLHSSWPVLQIWQANQENASDEIIALVPGHHDYAIWRHGQDLHIEPLQAVQFRFLSMLGDETSLLAIFENLWREDPGLEIESLLGQVLQAGWCCGWRTGNTPQPPL